MINHQSRKLFLKIYSLGCHWNFSTTIWFKKSTNLRRFYSQHNLAQSVSNISEPRSRSSYSGSTSISSRYYLLNVCLIHYIKRPLYIASWSTSNNSVTMGSSICRQLCIANGIKSYQHRLKRVEYRFDEYWALVGKSGITDCFITAMGFFGLCVQWCSILK